jgi:hypothetical protein
MTELNRAVRISRVVAVQLAQENEVSSDVLEWERLMTDPALSEPYRWNRCFRG